MSIAHGEVVHSLEAFTDAIAAVVDRDFWLQAGFAYAELGLDAEAYECGKYALAAERQVRLHADAALAGAFA